jgi:Tfp pilus assembly protein PilX
MRSESRDLILVLAVMAVLFIFGLVAVGVFIRVWLKERGTKNR